VWARPDNLEPDRSPDATAVAARWCARWRGARPDPAPDLEERCDLGGWGTGADGLRVEMAALLPALDAGDSDALAAGFVTSAAVLRHLQADPLLPAELLPTDWPGEALRADYDRYDAAYRTVLRSWLLA
jgi:phenylacetic acid degradation operon negative regulatory protein